MSQVVLCNEVIRSFKQHLPSAQWLQDAVSRAASDPTLIDLIDSEGCDISFFYNAYGCSFEVGCCHYAVIPLLEHFYLPALSPFVLSSLTDR